MRAFAKIRSKKGMELSINILTIMIITIAIFVMAIAFLVTMGSKADDAKAQLEEEAIRQLEQNVAPGTKVAVLRDTMKVDPGDTVTFNIYVLNILPGTAKFDFEVSIGEAFDPRGQTISDSLDLTDVFIPSPLVLEKNEHGTKKILVMVPGNKQKGRYVININVVCQENAQCPDDSYDGYAHKLFLDVS